MNADNFIARRFDLASQNQDRLNQNKTPFMESLLVSSAFIRVIRGQLPFSLPSTP